MAATTFAALVTPRRSLYARSRLRERGKYELINKTASPSMPFRAWCFP